MIVCKRCNKENKVEAVYCANCGSELGAPIEPSLNKEAPLNNKEISPAKRAKVIIASLFILVILVSVSFVSNRYSIKSSNRTESEVASKIDKSVGDENLKQPKYQKTTVIFLKDGALWGYSFTDKSIHKVFDNNEAEIRHVVSSPNGKYFAIVSSSAGKSSSLRVVEPTSKKSIDLGDGEAPIWFPDGDKLLFSSPNGKKIYYLKSKSYLLWDETSKPSSLSSVSPDGKYVITYSPHNAERDNPKDEIYIANYDDKEIDKQNALWIFDYSTNLEWKNENTFFAEKPSGGSGGNDIYEIKIINGNEFKSKYVDFGTGAIISPDKQNFAFISKRYYDEGGSYGALTVHDYKSEESSAITPAWPDGMGTTDYSFWSINRYEWLDDQNIVFSRAFYRGSDDLQNNQPIKTELWAVRKDGTGLQKITDTDNESFVTSK